MPHKYEEIFAGLMAPFANEHSRQGAGNRSLTFITRVQAMNRLDDVIGPMGWYDSYVPVPEKNGAICRLTLVMPDGSTLTREAFGGGAGMDAEDDDFKSTESDAFKRAASKFGVGRYLGRDGVPQFAAHRFEGYHGGASQQQPSSQDGGGQGGGGYNSSRPTSYDCPRSGKALFAWMKEREQEFNYSVLDAINGDPYIKANFPGRMTEYNDQQVAYAYAMMKRLWTEAGRWPQGAGNSPGEVSNNAAPVQNAPGTVAQPPPVGFTPAQQDQIRDTKTRIKKAFMTVIQRENPGVTVTYPMLLGRANAEMVKNGMPQIPDIGPSVDLLALANMAMVGERLLAPTQGGPAGDGMPF